MTCTFSIANSKRRNTSIYVFMYTL